MIRTMYTVNRSMNVLQKQQENTSGNISNANTPGYKFNNVMQSTLRSHEMINYAGGMHKNRRQVLGDFTFGNQIDETVINFGDGSLYQTENFTDFGIQGEGFFTIELLGGGMGYTRNGNFRIEEDGALVTQTGERVLGRNGNGAIGPIYVDEDFKIDYMGGIVGTNGSLLISDFENYNDLIDRGNTIFTTNGGVNIIDDPKVMQSYLETSNVDFTSEIVKMIEISREFESNQKMIQAADETLAKAVNDIGRL